MKKINVPFVNTLKQQKMLSNGTEAMQAFCNRRFEWQKNVALQVMKSGTYSCTDVIFS